MKHHLLWSALTAILVSALCFFTFQHFQQAEKAVRIEHVATTPASRTAYTLDEDGEPVPLDFTGVAARVNNTVVHIRSTRTQAADAYGRNQLPDLFEEFFGPQFRQPQRQPREPRPQMGSGSGVIISADGYIVTNNHVIDQADQLDVTLYDNRTFTATVIGIDPTTDLALLKIDAQDLPVLAFVDSDAVRVGEWVLAVGNPFNLNSTVTAGIVSAKGRNINILQEQFAVESFIQTDAAINPGNSGGALVDLNGGLVGINTAIASPTGAYSGYGFAIPANIVQKVVEDLMEYGAVQRGVLGVMIRTVNSDLKTEQRLQVNTGAYVDSLLPASAAAQAGIEVGDVIVAVEGQEVLNSPQLQERIARHRPGDVVDITVDRKGKKKSFQVTLNNREGEQVLVASAQTPLERQLGLNLEDLSTEEAAQLQLNGGVKVSKLLPGKLRQATNMREGFIITKIDGKSIDNKAELLAYLDNRTGGVMLEGVYPDREGVHYYAFGM
jgi:serine protease Do